MGCVQQEKRRLHQGAPEMIFITTMFLMVLLAMPFVVVLMELEEQAREEEREDV